MPIINKTNSAVGDAQGIYASASSGDSLGMARQIVDMIRQAQQNPITTPQTPDVVKPTGITPV